MIVGETRVLRWTETGETAFVFDETPTLAVTLPDGTLADPAPTITVSPGTSSLTQTLSAPVAFPQGGVYRMALSEDVGAQDPIIRLYTYFAAWTDVYSLIRERTQKSVTELTDAVIDPALARFVRVMLARWPCLSSYNALTGNDRENFDTGMALSVAARFYGYLPHGSNVVSSVKQGPLEVKYATNQAATSDLVREWLDEAAEALGLVSCIRAAKQARASASPMFVATGPTRAARAAGQRTALIDDLLRLLDPEWGVEDEL